MDEPKIFGNVSLLQIGRRYCAESEIIPPHTHQDYYELTIVTGGQGTVLSNGESFEVFPGDCHLSIPCDIHEIHASDDEALEYDYFSFTLSEGIFRQELSKVSRKLFGKNSRVFKDPKIANLIANAISEFSSEKPFSKEILENIFNQITVYLIRDFSDVEHQTAKFSENEKLCYQIMNYIDTHLYSILNLETVATRFKYNYSYLSSLFKKTTGKKLLDYFQSRKLETAKVLILENKYKITEIASMLNYSSPFSFSKAFKQKFGCSPKNFKK